MTCTTIFSVALAATLLLPQTALSADWAAIQTVSNSATITLSQDSANGSEQAINGVILDDDNDSLITSNQTVSVTGSDLTLEQTGLNTNSNIQALNLASAQSLDTVTQEVSGFDTAQINYNSASGADNIQALNYARSSNNTQNLSQLINGTSLVSTSDSVSNIQALNYSEASAYSGTLEQTANLETLEVSNLGGTSTRVNSIQGDLSGLTTPAVQSINIGTLIVNGGSTVIMNHVGP